MSPSMNPASSIGRLHLSLKDTVAAEVRRKVFSAELAPGSKIDQDRLAVELGVSKVPVREALILLHTEGIIDNIPRRGAFVSQLTPDDVRDHYRVFGVVSGLAAERAAEHIGDETLGSLREIAEQMESGIAPPEQERLNAEFHRVLNGAARSPRLQSVLRTLVNALPQGFYESHEDWTGRAHRDHRLILDALVAGDSVSARRLVEEHFGKAGEEAVTLLRSRGFWDRARDI